ncbi:beta-1,4-galactosyltransferase 7 isoform X1 [Ischnura elegans]|uniref:beta-1,4-galactosyltransferase 7 isoform X1 n=1 Tax=Ischnura elegans TaxID=197161 RepID=UPI001ED89E2C|nr:beta-1,4-galactosyltransferase 7 isoform X1 [Ischnura elegans]XP_046384350.1 beta-1,4-galactosyltransferase 7 isoform X1 [Ischnura elegans]
MAWRILTVKFFVLCLFGTLIISYFLAISSMVVSDGCNCNDPPTHSKISEGENFFEKQARNSGHKLGILVPYRDRFEELMVFIPHMQNFLKKQNIVNHIYVMNQVDSYRFNRASLINVGFELSMIDGCDYIAMHDVDLLPLNSNLSYAFPADGPVHLAAPHLHPRYHYPTFVGGILILKRKHFKQVNGMSNKYWGWGLEDDEFYVRLKEAGLNITRPQNISTGTHDTFRHMHDRLRRRRDMAKCYNQREVTRKRDRQTGLSTLQYSLESHRKISVDGGDQVSLLEVRLYCDRTVTPWCECTPIPKTSEKSTLSPRLSVISHGS